MVVTKVDIAPESVLKQTRQTLARYLRKNAKMPYPIKEVSPFTPAIPLSMDAPLSVPSHTHTYTQRFDHIQMSQVEAAAASIASDRVTPVFAISSVTGQVTRRS